MNWDGRIAEAQRLGKFTKDSITKAQSLKTCSLGERMLNLHGKKKLTQSIALQYMHDADILFLAVEFTYNVNTNRIKDAKKIHDRIKKVARIK